ncbi:MAG: radical SAM protein [Geothermobacteraceae bacterium]
MTIYPVFLANAACPRRCVYCDQTRLSGVAAIQHPRRMLESLARMLPEAGAGEVAFYGGSFTLLPPDTQNALLAGAAEFVARGRCRGIRLSTHPAGLGQGHLDLLSRYPVTTVEVGCQSFDDRVLRAAGRGHSAAQSLAGLERLLVGNWQVVAQMMPGLPGADFAEAEASLRTVVAAGIRQVRIYPVVVLEGTPLAEMYRTGTYRPWSLDEAVDCCARLWRQCLRSGVRVIRMGLPPLEDEPVAGPWHPAFGQLVRSRMWYHALATAGCGKSVVTVAVHPDDLSDAVGYRRQNIQRLEGEGLQVRLEPDPALDRLCIRDDGRVQKIFEVKGLS